MNDLAALKREEHKLIQQDKKERDSLKKKLAALKKKIRAEEQKQDARRGKLLGRCMMQKFKKDATAKAAMLQDLGRFLTRTEDRALFDLPQKK